MMSREQIEQALEDISDSFAEGKMQAEDVDPHVRIVLEAARAFLPFAPTQCPLCKGRGQWVIPTHSCDEGFHRGNKPCIDGDHQCFRCGGSGIQPWQPTDQQIEQAAKRLAEILRGQDYAPPPEPKELDRSRAYSVLVAAFRVGEVQP